MNDELRNKIYAAYGKAVIFNNVAELILKHLLAMELSQLNKSEMSVEIASIEKSASEFGQKMKIFEEKILAVNSTEKLRGLFDLFKKVQENRNYLAHVATGESGILNSEKIFQPTGFVLLEWIKKDGTVVPQQTLTEDFLNKIIEDSSTAIDYARLYTIDVIKLSAEKRPQENA